MRRIGRLGIAACAAMAVTIALAAPALAQEQTQLNTVTVEARRQVDVEPDVATVILGVTSKGLSAQAATDRLTNKARRVLTALRGAGFTDDELSTVNVDLFRTCLRRCQDPDPTDKVRPVPVMGFRANAGIRIETNRLNRIGVAIDVGIGAGATSIRGVSFDVEDKAAAVNEALRQAMEIAVAKARTLAETGGRTLGPALIITEGRTEAPRAFAVADAALGATIAGTSGGGTTSNPFPIEPPTLSASARIVVTFELL
ncbi:MAG: SIMPL domain-containing protein [Actinomycetota bacterium]|nr:SIMPL domain-containing protein [Actinomycetota bacterium]